MSEEQAYHTWVAARFAKNGGEPFCPRCGCATVYKLKKLRKFTCKGCARQFSATTGTIFADRKLSFKKIIEGIMEFSTPTTGINANSLRSQLGVNYRTAYYFARKLREFMNARAQVLILDGDVEVDGMVIGGFERPMNNRISKNGKFNPKVRRRNNAKKQTLVALRQRGGAIVTTVVSEERDAQEFVMSRIPKGSTLYTDGGNWWNRVGFGRNHKVINHNEQFWRPDADTNSVESFFGIVRRVVHGLYHRISGGRTGSRPGERAFGRLRAVPDRSPHPLVVLASDLASSIAPAGARLVA